MSGSAPVTGRAYVARSVSLPADLDASYRAARAAFPTLPSPSSLLATAMRALLATTGTDVPAPPPPTRTAAASAARWPARGPSAEVPQAGESPEGEAMEEEGSPTP